MAIYEISHLYDKKYFRKDRSVIMVGNNFYQDVLCECTFDDNIAHKNPNYCELTALYVLHKNTKDKFYGIEHYRRYFCDIFGNPITVKECEKILKQGKLIVPVPNKMQPNNFLNFCIHHFSRDIERVRDIIISDYRDYFDAFDSVMFSDKLSCYNMIVCNEKVYHGYCDWLFEVLDKVEKQTNIKDYSAYQARLYGFLSERLLNVWVKKNIPKNMIVYRDVKQVDQKDKSMAKVLYRTYKANLLK